MKFKKLKPGNPFERVFFTICWFMVGISSTRAFSFENGGEIQLGWFIVLVFTTAMAILSIIFLLKGRL